VCLREEFITKFVEEPKNLYKSNPHTTPESSVCEVLDPSVLSYSLSLHRHPYICTFPLDFVLSINNKQKMVFPTQKSTKKIQPGRDGQIEKGREDVVTHQEVDTLVVFVRKSSRVSGAISISNFLTRQGTEFSRVEQVSFSPSCRQLQVENHHHVGQKGVSQYSFG
jgi:hypothetical protein